MKKFATLMLALAMLISCAAFGMAEDITLDVIICQYGPKTNDWFTGTGMNGCAGDLVFEINGGKFASDVYAVCRIGTNNTANTAKLNGSVTMKITGGEFAGKVGLYQSADTPKAGRGKTTLQLGGSAKSMQGSITGFDKTEIVD